MARMLLAVLRGTAVAAPSFAELAPTLAATERKTQEAKSRTGDGTPAYFAPGLSGLACRKLQRVFEQGRKFLLNYPMPLTNVPSAMANFVSSPAKLSGEGNFSTRPWFQSTAFG
jgi:hypothetical protein